jgi:protoporphyrin/coproporphyrin ferrochelatase
MRFSDPTIDAAVAELVDQGCVSVVGICLSPQWSPLLMGGYERALRGAIAAHAPETPYAMVGAWHRTPQFIDLLAATSASPRDAAGRCTRPVYRA